MTLFDILLAQGTSVALRLNSDKKPSREFCVTCALRIASGHLEAFIDPDPLLREQALELFKAYQSKTEEMEVSS